MTGAGSRTAWHPRPELRAVLWMIAAGLLFVLLNAVARLLAQHLDPLVVRFLRYVAGLVVMLPFVWRVGLRAYRPARPTGQVRRGAIHAAGLMLFSSALPHVPLAEFTTPLFIMPEGAATGSM
jgi:drug/metabolite transporter (DMT)-like permease